MGELSQGFLPGGYIPCEKKDEEAIPRTVY